MNELEIQILEEIKGRGPITFARFMELALYAPKLGYYEKQPEIGRRGDFFTSVSVGSVFGELLAFQFAEWLDALAGQKAQIVEAGAHQGQLAHDITNWFKQFRPDLAARLEYYTVEASAKKLPSNVRGIIFSNELLDAMPVHRLVWTSGKWMESCVGCDGNKFVWETTKPCEEVKEFLPNVPAELAAVLPEGFSIEVSPAAIHWWRMAAESLRAGKLLAIDYGLRGDERFRPERSRGTLRAFRKHHPNENILEAAGEQDITAQVDFSAVQKAGESAGLKTEELVSQAKFLMPIFARTTTASSLFSPWTGNRGRQFQTLTHPEHLGQLFRVLVQSRGLVSIGGEPPSNMAG